MKRGKDDETIMGPMFPRLHVNDAEKGGPRAPPRNKMALYEQLSVPSQRFSRPGMMPLNHNNNANFVPLTSPSQGQGQGHGKSTSFPVQVPPSRHLVQKTPSHYLDPHASSAQVEQRKKLDEDDFMVPIFVYSEVGQDSGENCPNMGREKLSPSSRAYSSYPIKLQSATSKDPKQVGIMGLNVTQNVKIQNGNTIKDVSVCRKQNKTVSNSQFMDDAEGPPKQSDASLTSEPRDDTSNDLRRLQKANSRLQPGQGVDSAHIKGHVFSSQLIDVNDENSSIPLTSCPLEMQRNLDCVVNDTESREKQTCRSLQPNIEDKGDDVSETSMIDSVSAIDISPDDVVGIIGQKHFWKARRAIVNQQRVFAVQVFELHRLIKVQRSIAETPHLLLEDSAYLEKPIKASSPKKLPLPYIAKPPANISKNKNDSEKALDKMECSAENTVEKVSLSSVQNGSQTPSYRPFAGNPPVTPVIGDPNLGPWRCHPSQGHQWLIPVMSPSEGLIYKPYSGSGFPNPVCGSCGPPGSSPVMGNILPPAYGVPASHHHYQGLGVPTFLPAAGPHGYFPPYGMPITNPAISGQAVDQMSHFPRQGLQGQLSGGGANFSVQHQNSYNLPGQKSGAQKSGTVSDVPNLNAPKESELQASTASSPFQRAQGTGLGNTTEGNNNNVLPLFPTSPAADIPDCSTRHHEHEHEQPTQVIRVVPHNGRSASEFAARIFRSIQEERKQHDSI